MVIFLLLFEELHLWAGVGIPEAWGEVNMCPFGSREALPSSEPVLPETD